MQPLYFARHYGDLQSKTQMSHRHSLRNLLWTKLKRLPANLAYQNRAHLPQKSWPKNSKPIDQTCFQRSALLKEGNTSDRGLPYRGQRQPIRRCTPDEQQIKQNYALPDNQILNRETAQKSCFQELSLVRPIQSSLKAEHSRTFRF